MVSIWTPFPESVGDWVRALLAGPVGLTLWRLFVVALLLATVVYLLAVGSVVGGAVAAVVLATLFDKRVRAVVADLWNADFWVLNT